MVCRRARKLSKVWRSQLWFFGGDFWDFGLEDVEEEEDC